MDFCLARRNVTWLQHVIQDVFSNTRKFPYGIVFKKIHLGL